MTGVSRSVFFAGFLAAVLPAQDHQDRRQPFPQEQAKWVIKGRVRAKEPVVDFKKRGIRIDPIDLSLEGVIVHVVGLEKRWRTRVPEQPLCVRLTPKGIVPVQPVIVHGQWFAYDKTLRPVVFASLGIRREAKGALHRYLLPEKHWGKVRFPFRLEPVDPRAPRSGKARVRYLAHRFFAVSDKGGQFQLPALPKGEYELVAEAAGFKPLRARALIDGEEPKALRLVFPVPASFLQPLPVVPRTRAQRRDFVAKAIDPQRKMIRAIVYEANAEGRKKRIPATFSRENKAKALKLLDAVSDAEFVFLHARWAAVEDWVLTAPDLEKRPRRFNWSGNLGARVNDPKIWGEHRQVGLQYWLSQKDYPACHRLRLRYWKADRAFEEFVKQ